MGALLSDFDTIPDTAALPSSSSIDVRVPHHNSIRDTVPFSRGVLEYFRGELSCAILRVGQEVTELVSSDWSPTRANATGITIVSDPDLESCSMRSLILQGVVQNYLIAPVMRAYAMDQQVQTQNHVTASRMCSLRVSKQSEVSAFLAEHADLHLILKGLLSQIDRYFPSESFTLSVSCDPEEGDRWLVFTVETERPVESAMESMERFEQEYWLDVFPETGGKICVMLGFI